MSNSNADDMKAGLAAAEAAVARERDDEQARRAAMGNAKPPAPMLSSTHLAQSVQPTYRVSPEQHAEVTDRLDTINASLQQLDASLQRLISLLSQGK